MAMFDLTGKTALVTGASRGIGEAIAKGFAKQGASVVLCSRKQEGVDAVAQAIRADGGNAVAIACHVGKADQVDALFARIRSECGRLDVLVNNAATNPYFGPIIAAPEAAYDKTFEVNCKGYFLVAQRAAQMMVEQNGGSIINVASIEGLTPSPMMGVYSMTKAAVVMLTKALARELGGSNVRCNCLCPGLTETYFSKVLIDTPEIHDHYIQRAPLGRHAQPDEMVGAAVFLASDAASYTTGAVLTCDGGTAV
ncbi:MAG TPA: glucose 1-dehydrogenase [Candidatus Hydrogenedentes bacterium]|nr:glucose 1-dehydrogenase [Candidatus Hydrogenedentota bacterium]